MLKYFISNEGKYIQIDEAIKNGMDGYPIPYLKLCAQQRTWTGIPSTTQLINGTRLEYLKLLTPYAEDPDGGAFRLHGTMSHVKLEDLTPVDHFAELAIPEEEISGIADLLYQHNEKWILCDYKTWGSYKVGMALGLEKKFRPMFDSEGVPVVYLKSGKWGEAGTQKQEAYYEPNPDRVDMYETELQLNKYRMMIEKYFDIEIFDLRVFAIIRDGNTITAKSRGITKNTQQIPVRRLDDDVVNAYFSRKKEALVNSVKSYEVAYRELFDKNPFYCEVEPYKIEGQYDKDEGMAYDILVKNCPAPCNNFESWDGRRCEGYCPVSHVCRMITEGSNE